MSDVEVIDDIDKKQEIVNNLEWELMRIQSEMADADPAGDLWQTLSNQYDKTYERYEKILRLYYPENYRENVSSSYARETIRKEDFGIVSQKDEVIAELQRSIVEMDALMTQFSYGSDEYQAAVNLKQQYVKAYLDAVKIQEDKKNSRWDRIKWVGGVVKDVVLCGLPLLVYWFCFQDSLRFESEGSYRSRTTSMHIGKMAPKVLQG